MVVLSESEARLGELARHDYWLQVHCHECRHFGTLDPNVIGRIYGTRKLLSSCTFTCTTCESSKVSVKVLPGHLIRRRKAAAQ